MLLVPTVFAEVRLPSIFSDHMVLQRAAKTPVWGTAAPGEKVAVSLGKGSANTVADRSGRWRVDLSLQDADAGPCLMTVCGTNQITIQDVAVGQVWLASGQSNMDWRLRDTIGAPKEIARSADPMLRVFKVMTNMSATPQSDCRGAWVAATPQSAPSFSAVSYYFGKTLRGNLQAPVGIINASVGGTLAIAWTSAESIGQNHDLKAGEEKTLERIQAYPQLVRTFGAAMRDWLAKTGRNDPGTENVPDFASPGAATDTWKKVTMPGTFVQNGLPDSGVVWLRKDIPVTPNRANRILRVDLGVIHGFDSAYWNGVKIGETTPDTPESDGSRTYHVPAALTAEGTATLAVRVFAPMGNGGISATRDSFRTGSEPGNLFYLPGNWLAKAESELPPVTAAELASLPRPPARTLRNQDVATCLFNAMINPLIPYGIKGVIWYQGESDADRAWQYRTVFPLLISDWRSHWGADPLPFYFCQLPAYQKKSAIPGESAWAELREAQSVALSLPGTEEAVLIDLGEEGSIHPREKKAVGERLANIALAKTYDRDIPRAGPRFKSMALDGSKARITFDQTGLLAKPLPSSYQPLSTEPVRVPLVRNSPQSEVEGFAICGEDHVWKWANAGIAKDGTVVVWSDDVARPAAVRYAWADNPTCNLFGNNGLPVAPFRTDSFPAVTRDKKYGF